MQGEVLILPATNTAGGCLSPRTALPLRVLQPAPKVPPRLVKSEIVLARINDAEQTEKSTKSNRRRNGNKKKKEKPRKRAKSSTLLQQAKTVSPLNAVKVVERSRAISTSNVGERLRADCFVRLPNLSSASSLPRPATSSPRQGTPDQTQTSAKRKNVPLLTAIRPENLDSERERFLRARFNYNPYFLYRYPANPEVLDRFANPSDKLLPLAVKIMDIALKNYGSYEEFERASGGALQSRGQILLTARKYLKREGVDKEVMILLSEDLMSRGAMTRISGQPTLAIRVTNMRQFWLDGLLRHEIGTHYLRSANNRCQIWQSWKKRKELNLGSCNPTEEGLASLHSVLFRDDPCLWRAALLYYTAYHAAHMAFSDLFKDLGKFVKDPYVRWDYCMRAKRGQTDTSKPGGFCKDQVYLKGALELLKHRKTVDFSLLTKLGKICYKDIGKLHDIADLENTRIPSFMNDAQEYKRHLNRIMEKNGITDEDLDEVL